MQWVLKQNNWELTELIEYCIIIKNHSLIIGWGRWQVAQWDVWTNVDPPQDRFKNCLPHQVSQHAPQESSKICSSPKEGSKHYVPPLACQPHPIINELSLRKAMQLQIENESVCMEYILCVCVCWKMCAELCLLNKKLHHVAWAVKGIRWEKSNKKSKVNVRKVTLQVNPSSKFTGDYSNAYSDHSNIT